MWFVFDFCFPSVQLNVSCRKRLAAVAENLAKEFKKSAQFPLVCRSWARVVLSLLNEDCSFALVSRLAFLDEL